MLTGALQWLLLGGPTVGAEFGSQDSRVEATALVQVSDGGGEERSRQREHAVQRP